MMSEKAHRRPPVGAVVALLTAVLTVLLIAFAWPAARSEPRDLPVGVAGPAAVTSQVTAALDQNAPGAFEVHDYADRAAAVAAIEDREVYGAIVPGPNGVEVLTASAGSPAVAQILTQLAGRLGQQTGAAPTVTDVVPLPQDDPRGAGLAAGALPLVLGGIIAAVLLTRLVPSGSRRIAGALAFAVTGGLALTAVLQYWLGALEGSYWANSGVVALSIAATSVAILGLEWLLGPAGLGLGAVIMMLLGNPLSGLTSAPEMLPTGWGALGQLLPPGAAGSMLRSVSFFDGAAIGKPVIVLTSWLVAGLLLSALGAARARSKQHKPAPVRSLETVSAA
jgi:hypothetical protein